MEVGHEAPAISVVIPTFNRVAMLRRVLQAYEHQEPSGLVFELVIVDDGSTDGTWDLLAQWRSRRFSLRCERQVNAGPAAAAAARASGIGPP
jgi:glycosyltransferase involved in cell wall biosynthesis